MEKTIYVPVMVYGSTMEPAWWEENDRPAYYESEQDGMIHFIKEFIDQLQDQLHKVENGEIAPADADLECDEMLEECTIDDEGIITTKDGTEIYNPKTFVR